MTTRPKSKTRRTSTLARRTYETLIDDDTRASLAANEDAYSFSKEERKELERCFDDYELIRQLEVLVGIYRRAEEHRECRGAELQAMLKSERRISARLTAFLREVEAASPPLRERLAPLAQHATEVDDELRSGRGRAPDKLRWNLQLEVGQVLMRNRVRLTKGRTGKLAVALQVVVCAVDPKVEMSDPMPVLVSVCDALQDWVPDSVD